MEYCLTDLRQALRRLAHSPTFFITSVLCLGLGFGINVAVFNVFYTVLLRPLPFSEPQELVWIWEADPARSIEKRGVPRASVRLWKEHSQMLEDAAVFQSWRFTLPGAGGVATRVGGMVSTNYFDVLGLKPASGRGFLDREAEPGRNRVVILSHALWQSHFGEDPELLGKTITLYGADVPGWGYGDRFRVIGILAPEAKLRLYDSATPIPLAEPDIWVPLLDRLEGQVVGRLDPDVSISKAQAELETLAGHDRTGGSRRRIQLVPFRQELVGEMGKILPLVAVAVAFVLLLACINVANLSLVRCWERTTETAVRSSLGANRWLLMRPFLVEILLLCLTGGAVGMMLAWWLLDILRSIAPQNLLNLSEVSIDGTVVVLALLASLTASVLVGLAVTVQVSSRRVQEWLREGGHRATEGPRRRRWQTVLVAAQVSLSLILLIGSGLTTRSLQRLIQVDPGFDFENVITARISLPEYRFYDQDPHFFDKLLDRVRGLPGVQSAAASTTLPLTGQVAVSGFGLERKSGREDENSLSASYDAVSPDFFRVLRIPLIKGRHFTEEDRSGSQQVTLINEAMARRYFPDEDPLGKRLTLTADFQSKAREIVGVVGNVKHSGLDATTGPKLYVPHRQVPWFVMSLAIRSVSDPRSIVQALQREIQALDPTQVGFQVQSLAQAYRASFAEQRFTATTLGIYSVAALILAAVGIFGFMSYSLRLRTHEMGIRLALGASPAQVLRTLVIGGMTPVAVGLVLGLVGALLMSRLLESLLFEVSTRDPLSYVGLSAVLVAVSLIACLLPAWRATRLEPAAALRYE